MILRPIEYIDSSEYIGDSLTTINQNFSNLYTNCINLTTEIDILNNTPLPSASKLKSGIVRIGNGLSVTDDGVVSTELAQYQFQLPLKKDDNQSVIFNYDTNTLGVSNEKLYVLISDTDTFITSNSAQLRNLNTWFASSSSNILTKQQLSGILADFIPREIRQASTWVTSNTAKTNIVLQNLNSFIDARDWLDLYKSKIVQSYTWVDENSTSLSNAINWVNSTSASLEIVNNNTLLTVNTPELGDTRVKKITIRGNSFSAEHDSTSENLTLNINDASIETSSIITTIIQCQEGVYKYYINGYTNNITTNYIVNYGGSLLIPDIDYEITTETINLKFSVIETGKTLAVLALQNKILPQSVYNTQQNTLLPSNNTNVQIYGDNTFLGNVTGINITGAGTRVSVDAKTGIATVGITNTISSQENQQTYTNDLLPTGTIACFPNKKIPQGWLYCDGSSLDVKQEDTFNKLLTSIYCGDDNNNNAEYGFLSDSPKRDTEYYITIKDIFSETQTTLGTRDDGSLSLSIKGGSGSYKLKIGNKETIGTNETLTISNLNNGSYLNCSIIDTIYNKVIYFNLNIQYGTTQQSFVTFKNIQYFKDDILASTSRNINGRYLFLPDLTEELKRNKALFYCIKYS
jgi:hypothetical protein